jgi:hypothetical protein
MTIDAYLERNNGFVPVKDLTHCLEILRGFHEAGYFFRGHNDVDYRLVTTLDRYGGNLKWPMGDPKSMTPKVKQYFLAKKGWHKAILQ